MSGSSDRAGESGGLQVELEGEALKVAAELRRQQAVLWRSNTENNRTVQALHTAGVAYETAKVGRPCCCLHPDLTCLLSCYVRDLILRCQHILVHLSMHGKCSDVRSLWILCQALSEPASC